MIHQIPAQIESKQQELITDSEDLAQVREQIKDAELDAVCDAADARTEEGKPLYTNDKLRERAARATLRADAQYQRDSETARILERRVALLTVEIERMRREYRIALIDYERGQLEQRAAYKTSNETQKGFTP